MPSSRINRHISASLLITAAIMLLGSLIAGGQRVTANPTAAPILFVTDSSSTNRFGAYLGEIMRAEGFMAFEQKDISQITHLDAYSVVVLSEMALGTRANLFTSYVNGGGKLIAMRPDAQLNSLCGWSTDTATPTFADGYVKFDTSSGKPGNGLRSESMQYHGGANKYLATLAGGTTKVASFVQGTTELAPAIVQRSSGGGTISCWAYDLAKSVAYTRQGNPTNADVDTDGDGVLRTIDLFQANGGGDPWIDRDKISFPQADEQMRLFGHILEDFAWNDIPMPRLWYFPNKEKTMLILTGDAHANPLNYYELLVNSMNDKSADITIYLSKGGGLAGSAGNTQMQAWRAQGHEFGIHPYWNKPDEGIFNLQQGYDSYSGTNGAGGWYAGEYSSQKSRTVRNHQVAWKGWTEAAEIAVAHGIALDTNFYHWGPWLQKSDNSWPHGYITGSGQAMRFVKADGTVLPIYQQLTQLVDEQLLGSISGSGYEGLDGDGAFQVSKQLIDASLAGNYAALMTQFHVDYYNFGSPQLWAEKTLDYANQKSVPAWNADEWLKFIETRYSAGFNNLAWSPPTGRLSFTLQSGTSSSQQLTLMIPRRSPTGQLQGISIDGSPSTPLNFVPIKGRDYAFVNVSPGTRQVVATYLAAPTSTPTNTLPATNTPTITNTPSVTHTPTVTNTPVTTITPTNKPDDIPSQNYRVYIPMSIR
jgi:hypothetical protein